MCDCYQVGGPFISEDPDCPLHGSGSIGREDRIEEIVRRAGALEIDPSEAASLITEEIY